MTIRIKTWTPWRAFFSATLIGIACAVVIWSLPMEAVSTATLRVPGLEHESKGFEQARRMYAAQRVFTDETLRAAIVHFGLYPGQPEPNALDQMKRDLRVEQAAIAPSVGWARVIRVSYRTPISLFDAQGRFTANKVTSWATVELMREDLARVPKGTLTFDLLDAPSLPVTYEHRWHLDVFLMALTLGFLTGLVLAVTTWWRRRGPGATGALVPPPAMSGI